MRGRAPNLLPAEIENIRKAYADGVRAADLARRYGCCRQTIINHCNTHARLAKQRERQLDHRQCTHEASASKKAAGISGDYSRADPEAIEERDRRLALAPASLTAAFCGDPLPGYSALDRARARPAKQDAI